MAWDQRNKSGHTALHYAAGNQYIATSFQSRKRPDSINNAIVMFYLAVISFFTKRGVNLNIRDNSGQTPLHWAARDGNVAMGRSLIAHGADIEAENKSWQTPMHLATAKGHASFVKLLHYSHANLEPRDKRGSVPLELAAHGHHAEVMEYMISVGVQTNIVDHYGCRVGLEIPKATREKFAKREREPETVTITDSDHKARVTGSQDRKPGWKSSSSKTHDEKVMKNIPASSSSKSKAGQILNDIAKLTFSSHRASDESHSSDSSAETPEMSTDGN
jgi:ankyrin repeat protein